jgi:hypothetical protein
MSFVTTQPEMLAWATENPLGIRLTTAALVSQREPGGSAAVLIVGQDRRRTSRSGPTTRYGSRPTMTWLTITSGNRSGQTSIDFTATTAPRRPLRACCTETLRPRYSNATQPANQLVESQQIVQSRRGRDATERILTMNQLGTTPCEPNMVTHR